MQTSLKHDLERLSQLAFDRREWCEPLVRELHRLRKTAKAHPDLALMEKACEWLFVPFAFWAIDFCGLCAVVQERIASGERLESALRLIIESLPPLPGEKAQTIAAAHEHEVQRGDYGAQVRAGDKYALMEQQLMNDARFREEWAAIGAAFDVAAHRDEKGIIRRRMVAERGFRPDWKFDWSDAVSRFQAMFDLFCHRWNLYGMKGNRPLLMKLTVNLTPHGTMIVIPSWWSLDRARDLNWQEINKLHGARVPTRQGSKLTRNQMEQAAEAKKAARLNDEAKARGLKGDERERWVIEKLRWKDSDAASAARRLRRVLSRARRSQAC